METYSFDHIQPFASVAHVVLVSGIRNAIEILEDVKRGAKKFDQMPMTLTDAKMICSKNQLLVSVHQALLRNARGTSGLKTKTIHSEILWNLSSTNNIAETFKTFGLSASTKDLILVHIAQPPSNGGPEAREVLEKVESIVEGHIDGLGSLDSWRDIESPQRQIDWQAICKAYKLVDLGSSVGREDDKDSLRLQKIDSLVTSMVAMKFVSS